MENRGKGLYQSGFYQSQLERVPPQKCKQGSKVNSTSAMKGRHQSQ